MRSAGPAHAAAGFTLLELVVALSLTSLLTVVAYGSLSISLKAVGRGQLAAERLQELRVGQNILERSLSSAVRGSLADQIYFIGDPRQMRFFTLEPLEAYNLGGVYHWRVLLGQDEAGNGVLAVEQTKNVNWYRDPEGVEVRQIILRGVVGGAFRLRDRKRGIRELERQKSRRPAGVGQGLPDPE